MDMRSVIVRHIPWVSVPDLCTFTSFFCDTREATQLRKLE